MLVARPVAMTTRRHLATWSLLLAVLPFSAQSQLAAPLSVRLTTIDSTPPARIRTLVDISTCHAWTCDQALSLGVEMAGVASWRVGTEITGSRSVLPGGEGRV